MKLSLLAVDVSSLRQDLFLFGGNFTFMALVESSVSSELSALVADCIGIWLLFQAGIWMVPC